MCSAHSNHAIHMHIKGQLESSDFKHGRCYQSGATGPSLGRRSVTGNLLQVAQRTNALQMMPSAGLELLGREFEPHIHHDKRFLNKDESPHVKNLTNTLWAPRNWNRELVTRRPVYPVWTGPEYTAGRGGKSAIGLSLGRRSINLLPVAQRTHALTQV